MRIEQIAIAVVLFGLILTLGISLYSEQVSQYGLPSDGIVMGETFIADDNTLITNTGEIVTDSEVSTDNSDSAVAKAAVPASKNINDYKGSFTQKIEYITKTLKLPNEVKIALIAIIGILCTAFIIYMLRGFAPPKD